MTRLRILILSFLAALPVVAFGQTATQQQPTEFVPLTSVPGLETFKQSPNLAGFLNNIYMIAIGVAAALAVFQIIRAGVYFMLNKGSISEAEQARHLLQMSVLGLLLVLSPVIVFGIINPKILELNFAVDGLKTADTAAPTSISGVTAWSNSTLPRNEAKAKCEAEGGTAQFVCSKEGSEPRVVPIGEACKSDEKSSTQCIKKDGNFSNQCTNYPQRSIADSGICNGSNGYTQIAASCCGPMESGWVCCGKTSEAIVEQNNAVVASLVVQNMLNVCPTVQANSTQQQCLVTALTPTVDTFNKCVAQAVISGMSIDSCLSKLLEIVPGKVTGCITVTNDQAQCLLAAAGNYVRTVTK